MTIQLRRDKEIYATDGGWFQARWHFTFDRYYDPGQMGVGALRVSGPGRPTLRTAPAGAQGAARTAADAWRAATRIGSQTGENGGA